MHQSRFHALHDGIWNEMSCFLEEMAVPDCEYLQNCCDSNRAGAPIMKAKFYPYFGIVSRSDVARWVIT